MLKNRFSSLSIDDGDGDGDEKSSQKSSGKSTQKVKNPSNGQTQSLQDVTSFSSGDNVNRPLVWIDLEMTGLDVEKDRILEIACIITNGNLTKIIEGPSLVVHQSDEALDGMGEWCQEHHEASGLTKNVRESVVTEAEAESQVLEFVRKHTIAEKAQLAGNSVYNDLNFLRKYMPRLAAHFSHVIIDVSSVSSLCKRWFPRDADRAPHKKKNHRALDDIKESIQELAYFKKTIFKTR